MATRAERESRRARSAGKARGRWREGDEGCVTGHPAMWNMTPAIELDRMPEGGGYPVNFVQHVAPLIGCNDLAQIVHLCSGSVRARFTFDMRDVGAAVRADVRWLPLRPSSVRWILVDPPYDPTYAETMWGLGKVYPMPLTILRECARALRPGGRVGLLHHVVPDMPPELTRVGTYGVTTGVGYRIRAFTVAERSGVEALW